MMHSSTESWPGRLRCTPPLEAARGARNIAPPGFSSAATSRRLRICEAPARGPLCAPGRGGRRGWNSSHRAPTGRHAPASEARLRSRFRSGGSAAQGTRMSRRSPTMVGGMQDSLNRLACIYARSAASDRVGRSTRNQHRLDQRAEPIGLEVACLTVHNEITSAQQLGYGRPDAPA